MILAPPGIAQEAESMAQLKNASQFASWIGWVGGHSCLRLPPQRTGGGPPPSTAGSAEWLGSAVGNFILPWNWIIFGQVRLSYTKASDGLLKPVGNGCTAPWNTDWPWAFLDSRSPFLLNRDMRTGDLYATAAEGVPGSHPHPTPHPTLAPRHTPSSNGSIAWY